MNDPSMKIRRFPYAKMLLGMSCAISALAITSMGVRGEDSPTSQPLGARLLSDPRIINVHEHLMGPLVLPKYRKACEAVGIETTVWMGSSRFTFYAGEATFVDHHQNNEFICELARNEPGRFLAWVTFQPELDDMVTQLKSYLAKGATGVKLYLGHGGQTGDGKPFHVMPLDDPRMLALYDFCQSSCVPILIHINGSKFRTEMESILSRYPNVPWVIPHLVLLSNKLDDLRDVLKRHPTVLTDMSFGVLEYEFGGLSRISKNRDEFRKFVLEFQDRLLFGTDAVITGASYKNADFLIKCFMGYRHMLELEDYSFDVIGREGVRKQGSLKGLYLPEDVLRKIYRGNAERLLKSASINVGNIAGSP